ncbi:MAG TPA: hypothetical protein VFZ59_21480, partial [Verrucomicrobiae bacterium]|nr:hypothetical protein [Verrucomicrobiae bacterium]
MKTLVVALNLALVITVHAETAVEAWARRYSNLIDSFDQPTKVVTDTAGNVIVAGNTSDGVTGGDILVIKYANDGSPLWTNRYDGPGSSFDVATALGVDGSGSVIVAGVSGSDFATIKYSSGGAPLWTNRHSGEANAMVVDGGGNVIVTGISYDTEPNGDYATIKYSSSGVPMWTNRYNGPGNGEDWARAVAVDAGGNVFVTGRSYSGSSDDYATVAYSSLGVPLWTNRYNGPGNGDDVAHAVAVSGTNVFVTGSAYGGSSSGDYATIGYSTGGAALWVQRYNGSGNDYDEAVGVAVAGTNVFVTGYAYDALTSNDYLTLVYSRSGTALLTNRYEGPAKSDDRV